MLHPGALVTLPLPSLLPKKREGGKKISVLRYSSVSKIKPHLIEPKLHHHFEGLHVCGVCQGCIALHLHYCCIPHVPYTIRMHATQRTQWLRHSLLFLFIYLSSSAVVFFSHSLKNNKIKLKQSRRKGGMPAVPRGPGEWGL